MVGRTIHRGGGPSWARKLPQHVLIIADNKTCEEYEINKNEGIWDVVRDVPGLGAWSWGLLISGWPRVTGVKQNENTVLQRKTCESLLEIQGQSWYILDTNRWEKLSRQEAGTDVPRCTLILHVCTKEDLFRQMSL